MSSGTKTPLVSIGVIVYNEERYIRDTLESLLAQDYPDLEIIVANNSSTDRSGEICEEFARRDSRIRYVQHVENIGSAGNSIHVLDASTGEYFMWAAGHDLWAPNLVTRCVEALESHPDAAIAYASSTWIDASSNALPRTAGWYDTRGLGPIRRFFFAFWGNLHPVLGVIRARYLREIPKIHTCVGADQILLTELVLRGDFIHVPGTSWSRRQPRDPETYRDRMKRYTGSEFRMSDNWIDRRMPLLRLPIEQLRSVARSDLPLFDKLVMMLALMPAFAVRYLDGRRT